jgi:cell division septal protein FtsQ
MRKKSKAQQKQRKWIVVVQYLVLFLVIAFVLYLAWTKTITAFRNLEHFKIKNVVVNPTISFVQSAEIQALKGKNIFDVDLKRVQDRVRRQYPQVSQLKIVKKYPNEIYVDAKRRNIFAQIEIRNQIYVLDGDGIVLFDTPTRSDKLPLIEGVNTRSLNVQLGYSLNGVDVRMALYIIRLFRRSPVLSSYPLTGINVDNLSKINLYLMDDYRILIDRDKIERKLQILELLLSQKKINFDEIKYVDLRFREPIIKKK